MIDLLPLETLYEAAGGVEIPLPPELAARYGRLSFVRPPDGPYVISNFVTTLDGVVSLNIPGQSGGGEISGFNQHDRMVMGILRAVADAVVVGAGTLRAVPRHLWTAEFVYPPLAEAYRELRASTGRTEPPLNVIVTARGEIDLDLPVFRSPEVTPMIVTTRHGARRLREGSVPARAIVVSDDSDGAIDARQVIRAITSARPSQLILVEGGPSLLGDFLAVGCVDELFLTVAPQIAGRDQTGDRPGLVAGRSFAPEHAIWGTLIGIKRGESHLFLRYRFSR